MSLWLLLAGIASGFVFQRSRLCFVSALRDLYLFRALQMTRALLLLFLTTVAGGALLLTWRREPAAALMGPTAGGALAGGAIFAAGMVLAGSCAAGAFWRLGEGQLSQLYILLGMLVGTWVHVKIPLLTVVRVQTTFSGWAAAALLAVLLAVLYGWDRLQSRGGEELPPRRHVSRLRAPWSPEAGALVMALLLVGFMALTGRAWGVSRAFLLNDLSATMFAVGLVGGGFVGGRFGREFRLRRPGGRSQALIRLVGGVLMGYGARVGWGCTIGAVMSGMVNLSVQPWYWLIGAVIGAGAGSAVLKRYMNLYL